MKRAFIGEMRPSLSPFATAVNKCAKTQPLGRERAVVADVCRLAYTIHTHTPINVMTGREKKKREREKEEEGPPQERREQQQQQKDAAAAECTAVR